MHFASLEAAREWLMTARDEGTRCPCCDQPVKVYPRPIGSRSACWLIGLVRRFLKDRRAYHVTELPYSRADEAKLKAWGLIEEMENDDPKKKNSGFWKPTQLGIDFVHRRKLVPRRVYFFNAQSLGYQDENDLCNIVDCLQNRFDYSALMAGEL